MSTVSIRGKRGGIVLGIQEDKIHIEDKSTNTGDNFRFTKRLIEERNVWDAYNESINQKNYIIEESKKSDILLKKSL